MSCKIARACHGDSGDDLRSWDRDAGGPGDSHRPDERGGRPATAFPSFAALPSPSPLRRGASDQGRELGCNSAWALETRSEPRGRIHRIDLRAVSPRARQACPRWCQFGEAQLSKFRSSPTNIVIAKVKTLLRSPRRSCGESPKCQIIFCDRYRDWESQG